MGTLVVTCQVRSLVLLAGLVSISPWRAAVDAAVRPPKLDYQRLKLPNGLTVLLHQDSSTPIAHVQLWYHVGSKDERAGRTGFAHLFEHMMFKGSKNVEPEQHTSIVSSVGGQANAYTTEDATVYWQTVPAQYLPLVLWMEGDRMATLRIDDKTFRNEREVVKEERRMRIENQPYGRLNEILFDKAFTVHPYKHPVIGSMKDLEAATIDDVREFYRIVLRAGQLHDRDCRRFRDRPGDRARQPLSRPRARSPQRRAARHSERADPDEGTARRRSKRRGRCPAVVVAHHITYDGHPDAYPLHIVSKVLSDGQSSRIYRKLVYETGLALTAFGGGNIIEDPNLFFAVAIVNPGKSPAAVEKRAHRRARPAQDRGHHRTRAAARQEPVRARLHPRPRVACRTRRPTLRTPRSFTPTSRPRTASSTSSRRSRWPTCSAWRRPTSRPNAASSCT